MGLAALARQRDLLLPFGKAQPAVGIMTLDAVMAADSDLNNTQDDIESGRVSR